MRIYKVEELSKSVNVFWERGEFTNGVELKGQEAKEFMDRLNECLLDLLKRRLKK